MMRATVIGRTRLAARLRRLPDERRRVLAAAVQRAGRSLRSALRDTLRGDPQTVGEAGTAPRSRSGGLSGSIEVIPEKAGLATLVGSTLDYARYLEFGTRRMAARPWLLPTFLRSKASLARRVLDAARSRSA